MNYPENYDDNANCKWFIEVSEGSKIILDFQCNTIHMFLFPGHYVTEMEKAEDMKADTSFGALDVILFIIQVMLLCYCWYRKLSYTYWSNRFVSKNASVLPHLVKSEFYTV